MASKQEKKESGEEEQQGHSTELFIDQSAIKKYICAICLEVCRNVVEASCGHLFCQCHSKHIDQTCPFCKKHILYMNPSHYIDREIRSLLVDMREPKERTANPDIPVEFIPTATLGDVLNRFSCPRCKGNGKIGEVAEKHFNKTCPKLAFFTCNRECAALFADEKNMQFHRQTCEPVLTEHWFHGLGHVVPQEQSFVLQPILENMNLTVTRKSTIFRRSTRKAFAFSVHFIPLAVQFLFNIRVYPSFSPAALVKLYLVDHTKIEGNKESKNAIRWLENSDCVQCTCKTFPFRIDSADKPVVIKWSCPTMPLPIEFSFLFRVLFLK